MIRSIAALPAYITALAFLLNMVKKTGLSLKIKIARSRCPKRNLPD
jgi:hypothetical protein